MDFYKKINVDNFKPKLPQMPDLKLPKIKSRKIFKSSKEDISNNQKTYNGSSSDQQETPRFPPASFIDRTPMRISTVSSLQQTSYSASGYHDSRERGSYTSYEDRDFEDIHKPPEDEGLHQRFTRRYKEFQEFKFKNLFSKKTVVRKTEISMDLYADRYKEDYEREQQEERRRPRQSVDYRIEIKESDTPSPTDSTKSGVPTPIRKQVRDELNSVGRPLSKRKDWKIRSLIKKSEDKSDEEIEKPKVEHSQGWQFDTLKKRSQKMFRSKPKLQEDQSEVAAPPPPQPKKKWTMKSTSIDDEPSTSKPDLETQIQDMKKKLKKHRIKAKPAVPDEATSSPQKNWTLKKIKSPEEHSKSKHYHNDSGSSSNNTPEREPKPEKSWMMKSLRWNKDKLSQKQASDNLSTSPEKQPPKDDILKRWKNRTMNLLSHPNLSEVGLNDNEGHSSPRQKQWKTLQIWKRNRKISRSASAECVSKPSEEPKTMKSKFMNLRSGQKATDPNITVDEAIRENKKLSHKEKLENARDHARKRVNDQMQKIKFFRSGEASKDSNDSTKPERRQNSFEENEEEANDDEVAMEKIEEIPRSPAAIWASEQQFKKSLQSIEDDDYILNAPQVLIHQQCYENQEPTLIIAMPSYIEKPYPTQSLPASPIQPYPNLSLPSSPDYSLQRPHIDPILFQNSSAYKGHQRKQSIDSLDSDSWIPPTYQTSSEVGKNEDPWAPSAHFPTKFDSPKRKSVDIFQKDETSFDDFEDQLQDTPVLSIVKENHIKIQEKQAYTILKDESQDTPPSDPPTPPPTSPPDSPPPPLLPFRRPPPKIPERSESMVNLPRPIITQGSLRRKYSGDFSENNNTGRVNKLINRFETSSQEDLADSNPSIPKIEVVRASVDEGDDIKVIKPILSSPKITSRTNPTPSPRLTISPTIPLILPGKDENENQVIPPLPTSPMPIINSPPVPSRTPDTGETTRKPRTKQNDKKPTNNDINKNEHSPRSELKAGSKQRRSIKSTSSRDDDTYFSFSDEENSNYYSLGSEIPVFTRHSYVLEF